MRRGSDAAFFGAVNISGAKTLTCEIPAAELAAKFRDADRFLELCRACPNFGKIWACPPFLADPPQLEEPGASCELFMTEITMPEIPPGADPKTETERAYGAARSELDARLLEIERRTPRALALFGGSCRNCPLPACPRGGGLPCPRPQFARPSLEALGFDVSAIAREIFGEELEWASDTRPPKKIRIVSAVLRAPH